KTAPVLWVAGDARGATRALVHHSFTSRAVLYRSAVRVSARSMKCFTLRHLHRSAIQRLTPGGQAVSFPSASRPLRHRSLRGRGRWALWNGGRVGSRVPELVAALIIRKAIPHRLLGRETLGA